jgi:hypothetical protein
MKKGILIFSIFCAVFSQAQAFQGQAYFNTFMLAKYGAGDKQWQEDHDAWLNADDDKPMPEELNEWDGKAYQDGRDAVKHEEYTV